MTFTTRPWLLALIVAIANSPLNIYQVCAWEHGTIRTEPWRRKASTILTRAVLSLSDHLRQVFRTAGGVPALIGIACLILAVCVVPVHGTSHVLLAVPALAARPASADLKPLRQRASDLKADIAKASRERATIGETAITEKRALTDDERKKFGEMGVRITALEAQAADVGELLAAAVAANEAERAYTGDTSDPDANAATTAAAVAGIQANVPRLRLIEKPTLGVWGRQLQAVRNIAIKQATDEDRAAVKAMAGPMFAGPSGLNTDVPSEGGFLVAPERATTILQRSYMIGQILSRVFRMPIGAGSNGMKIPAIDETSRADNSRFGGIVSGWLGQGNTLAAGKPKFRELDLKLRKVGAFVYATDEQLADSIALEGWINRYLPLELMFRVEDAIINGTGANQPLGVLNSGAAITVVRKTAGRILYDDIAAMWSRMWAGSRGNSVWLIDQGAEPQLETLNIAIGTAGVLAPVWRPAGVVPNAGFVGGVAPDGSVGGGPGTSGSQVYGTLYGRPVIPVEYMAALGTTGDIILVNFDEYTLIDKGQVEQAVSLHVAFLTDEAVYRFLYRVDGQFNWNAPLTPKNGGATLGPLVVLQ